MTWWKRIKSWLFSDTPSRTATELSLEALFLELRNHSEALVASEIQRDGRTEWVDPANTNRFPNAS